MGAAQGADAVEAYLRRALPATGFSITADGPDGSALTFAGHGWSGSFTGDDRADVIGVKSSGEMYLYKGNGHGGFTGGGVKIGSGWGSFL